MTGSDVAAAKAALRRAMMARRAGFDPDAGAAFAALAGRDLDIAAGSVVAGVWPLPGEMDLRPLLRLLHARGHMICLPQTPPRGQPLTFRQWHPGAAMLPDRFGTVRPDGAPIVPDILFVPLLAFDRALFRLGYGGGYYDRTLASLPGRRAVGFGYAAQEVAHVPIEPHDRPLDIIATEQAIIRPAAST